MITEHRVHVTGYAPAPTEALVTVENIERSRRIRRAVAGFSLFFTLALLSVFIPVGHFILVPVFLISSVVTLTTRLAMTARVIRAHGSCPDCGREQDFDVQGSWRLPVDVTCRGCQRRLTMTAASPG